MDVVQKLIEGVILPEMVEVEQIFASSPLEDVYESTQRAWASVRDQIAWPLAGGRVAVAVGSRGVRNLPIITRATIDYLRSSGMNPFIIPAMGSHGGSTGEGQVQVLRSLGITEESVGAPIEATMEVIQVGKLDSGIPVYVDRMAREAEAVVVINRVKPHTAFRGPYESGLAKMMAIGLGKQKGAEEYHKLGFGYMANHVQQAANVILQQVRVLGGVAVLEDAYDRVADVVVVPAHRILKEEPRLLERAKALMPHLPFGEIDVLVVDELGKDISGDGMDPNITGRYATPYAQGGPAITRICVLGLTERTHGNANGLGMADICTKRAADAVDFAQTYPNALTSTVIEPVKLPMVIANDRLAIQAAIKTSNVFSEREVRLVHIQNTLSIDRIRVSLSLASALADQSGVGVSSRLSPWKFDSADALDRVGTWGSF